MMVVFLKVIVVLGYRPLVNVNETQSKVNMKVNKMVV